MPTRDEEIVRGNKAGELLRNEIFQEAFDTLQAMFIERWMGTDPSEAEIRERLHTSVAVLNEIRSHVESIATTGKMAAQEIETSNKDRFH